MKFNKLSSLLVLVSVTAILLLSVPMLFAQEQIQVDDVQFVSGNVGGSWLSMAAVISDRANQYFEGNPFNTIPGGSISNLPVIAKGDAQIGFSQGPFLAAALNGIAPYDKPMKNLRSVCSLIPMVVYLAVTDDIPGDNLGEVLKSISKLTIGTTPKGNSSCFVAEYIFNKYGINDLDDIKKMGGKVTYADGASLRAAWSDYHINFIIRNTSLPSSELVELLSIRKSKLVGLEEEVADKLVKENGFIKMTIPAGTYPDQDKNIYTVGLSTVVVVNEDVPDSVAYAIAKTVREDRSYIEAARSAFKAFKEEDMTKGLVFPMHKGAKKYYEEVGLMNK